MYEGEVGMIIHDQIPPSFKDGMYHVVCNGDISVMMEMTSMMTWFEEWFLYFEMASDNTCNSWKWAQ
jgi:hypothetical protein